MENSEFKNQTGLSPEELEELRKKLKQQELERQQLKKEQENLVIQKAEDAASQVSGQAINEIDTEEDEKLSTAEQKVEVQDPVAVQIDQIESENENQPEEIIPEYILGETDLDEQSINKSDNEPLNLNVNSETLNLPDEQTRSESSNVNGLQNTEINQVLPNLDALSLENSNPQSPDQQSEMIEQGAQVSVDNTQEDEKLFLENQGTEHDDGVEIKEEIKETSEELKNEIESNSSYMETIDEGTRIDSDNQNVSEDRTSTQSNANSEIKTEATAQPESMQEISPDNNITKSMDSLIDLPNIPVTEKATNPNGKIEQDELRKLRAEVKNQAEEIKKAESIQSDLRSKLEEDRTSSLKPENLTPRAETSISSDVGTKPSRINKDDKNEKDKVDLPKPNRNQSSEIVFIFFIILPFLVILYLYLIYFTDMNLPLESATRSIVGIVL
jgi:hypothetical protein